MSFVSFFALPCFLPFSGTDTVNSQEDTTQKSIPSDQNTDKLISSVILTPLDQNIGILKPGETGVAEFSISNPGDENVLVDIEILEDSIKDINAREEIFSWLTFEPDKSFSLKKYGEIGDIKNFELSITPSEKAREGSYKLKVAAFSYTDQNESNTKIRTGQSVFLNFSIANEVRKSVEVVDFKLKQNNELVEDEIHSNAGIGEMFSGVTHEFTSTVDIKSNSNVTIRPKIVVRVTDKENNPVSTTVDFSTRKILDPYARMLMTENENFSVLFRDAINMESKFVTMESGVVFPPSDIEAGSEYKTEEINFRIEDGLKKGEYNFEVTVFDENKKQLTSKVFTYKIAGSNLLLIAIASAGIVFLVIIALLVHFLVLKSKDSRSAKQIET